MVAAYLCTPLKSTLNGMRFVDGLVFRHAIHLSRAGVNDTDSGVELRAGEHESELGNGVHLQVTLGELHAVDVTDLSCEIEHYVRVGDDIGGRVADVGADETNPVTHCGDVVTVATAAGEQVVDDCHLRAFVHEAQHEIASNESQPAGDYRSLTGVSQLHPSRSFTAGSSAGTYAIALPP
jgi:hypothetical protein